MSAGNVSALDLGGFFSGPLAITPEGLRSLQLHVEMVAAGRLDPSAASATPRTRRQGTVAVIPVRGPLSHRATLLGSLLGWSNTADVAEQVKAALDDGMVSEILLHVESPGGSVYGIEELAAVVYSGRDRKRITAWADPLAASAAYWIGAAATRFLAMPSGEVGSIGVIGVHFDFSQALDKAGIKPTIIASSRYKGEGSEYAPLAPEARSEYQRRVDEIHARFVADVARFRGVPTTTVEERFGQGRVVGARDAVSRGMLDGLATSASEALLGGSRRGRSSVSAGALARELDGGWRPSAATRERLEWVRKLGA